MTSPTNTPAGPSPTDSTGSPATTPTSGSMRAHLLDLSDFAWQRLHHRLGTLTDEEYLWEPVPDAWTVRPAGDDNWAADGSALPPHPAPFTTLAWRIAHLADVLGAERTATWLGLAPGPDEAPDGPQGTAAAGVAALERAHAIWRRRLAAVSDAALSRPMGELAGPYADSDGAAFALHILDELIHHGAEIGVVRDLYQHQRGRDPSGLV